MTSLNFSIVFLVNTFESSSISKSAAFPFSINNMSHKVLEHSNDVFDFSIVFLLNKYESSSFSQSTGF